MTFWRFEFGKWISASSSWRDYTELSLSFPCCGCAILTIGKFYFTYLRNECYTKRDVTDLNE